MNRSVLARQMFAAGGAAFPDLSGDGKVTRKDILMGRGVPMQRGGDPQMAQLQAQADAMGISVQELLSMMEQQRQRENIDALQALRGRAQAQAMGADQYGFQGSAEFPGATTQAQADAMRANPDMASNIDEEGELYYNSQSAANKARFLSENEGMTSQDYERIFNYNRGGPVGMAMGGDPAMAQGVGSMMTPPPAMPPAQGPMGDAQAMDPQVIQGLLSEASQSIGDLDNAEDYATVINSIRGEEASIEERYEELAGIVGEEDAAQTPESVLALTQPAIMMGAVDQGIGGLAQEEMSEPVQGAMAQGIMSTVAPPPPAAPPMDPAMMGGPPPVNFNQGGLVRRGDNQPVEMMENGGEPGKFLPYLLGDRRFTAGSNTPTLDSMMLQNIAKSQNQSAARQALSPAAAAKLPTPELSYDERVLAAAKGAEARYAAAGLGTAAERAAELEEQKNLTQAQMLFDIAGTALAYAAPMQGERRGMSPAERLAMAASTTQLLPTIGARAQQQLEAKKVAGKEERALKLAAVQRGETQVDKEIAAEQAETLAKLKKTPTKADRVTLVVKNEDGGEDFVGNYDLSKPGEAAVYAAVKEKNPEAYPITGSLRADREPDSDKVVMYNKETGIQSPTFDIATEAGIKERDAWVTENQSKLSGEQVFEERERGRVPTPDRLTSSRDVFMKFGYDNMDEFNKLPQVDQDHLRGLDVVTPRDFFLKYGMDEINFSRLSKQDQRIKHGLPTLTDKDYLQAYDMTKAQFLALTPEEQNRKMGLVLEKELRESNGQLVVYDPATDGVTVVFGKPKAQPYKPMKIIKGGKETVVDVNTEAGRKAVEKANEDDTARVVNVGTEVKPSAKTFLIPGTGLVSSYDGGQTYLDASGSIQDMPQGPNAAFPLSDRTSYDIFRRESIRSDAKERIRVAEEAMTRSLTRPDGSIVPSTDSGIVANALMAARNATGPYANFAALMDGVIAGTIPSETARNFFKDTQDNRQFIRALKVLGSSALSVSPRMAVYDLARVERLFPDPDAIFRNPISEANKLVVLKQIVVQQKNYNDQNLAAGIDDATLRSEVIRKNYEIDRLLGLLEGVDAGGGGLNNEVQTQLMDDLLAGR